MSDYQQIHDFTTQLRNIKGLYLFKIFSKYTPIKNIDRLFNALAEREEEDDLRTLERLWHLFIKTGSISEFKLPEQADVQPEQE